MESRSFPSSFDIARRYAKHWKQYYLRYGEQGLYKYTPWNQAAKIWKGIDSAMTLQRIITPK